MATWADTVGKVAREAIETPRKAQLKRAAELARVAMDILLREAEKAEPDEDERALWRLIDAAGIVMRLAGETKSETGMGFRLVDDGDPDVSAPE